MRGWGLDDDVRMCSNGGLVYIRGGVRRCFVFSVWGVGVVYGFVFEGRDNRRGRIEGRGRF